MVKISLAYYFFIILCIGFVSLSVLSLKDLTFKYLCSLQLDRISLQVFHGMQQAFEINAANFCAFGTRIVFMT